MATLRRTARGALHLMLRVVGAAAFARTLVSASGTLQVLPCDPASPLQRLVYAPADGTIRNPGTGQCVTAPFLSASGVLILADCSSASNASQSWTIGVGAAAGTIRLTGNGTDEWCLNVAGGSTSAYTPVVLYACSSPPPANEVFAFNATSASLAPTGQSYAGLGLCVDAGTPPPPPFLSSVFGSHMVLQRDWAITVWGFAPPGTTVRATFNGGDYAGAVDGNGTWRIVLPPTAAGGPYSINVTGSGGQAALLEDVLIGDVYMCGGQ
jgi:type II secretory pathway pseudopilin PulG